MNKIQFTTKIRKSALFLTVTVRKERGVFYNDKIGTLFQGDKVTGEVSFSNVPNKDIWMQLTEGKYRGYWIAMIDAKGKVFTESVPDNPDVPPVESRYAFVEHHINSKLWGYKNYMVAHGMFGPGDPSVYQGIATKTTKVVYMTKRIQELVYGFNVQAAQGSGMKPSDTKKVWNNLTRWNGAYNNKKGTPQGFADYIQGINVESKQGIGAQHIVTTGSTLKLVKDPYKKYGVWCQDFVIADVLDPLTYMMSWYKDWHVIPAATNSYRATFDIKKGEYVVDPLGMNEIVGPFPFMWGSRTSFWMYMGVGTKVGTTYADGLRYLDYVPESPLWPYFHVKPVPASPYESFWDMRYAT